MELSSNEKSVATCLAICIGVPLLIVYEMFTYGYVLQSMWEWFIVPLGFLSITFWHAYGLILIALWLRHKSDIFQSEKKKIDWSKLFGYLTSPWITFGIGYLVHCFGM